MENHAFVICLVLIFGIGLQNFRADAQYTSPRHMMGNRKTSQECMIAKQIMCKCMRDCDEMLPIGTCKTGFFFMSRPGFRCCPTSILFICNII
ncbi:Hypothetical predicted protein [Mytilus galloprovincialis]|uniref:Uncharacterized protein n=1 Tax=Mytilus galloprovincialis TaxID=29158 RepID=A0A8B6DX66_MYTGA|nr:Hypothetical predicted protein [Mytilus galloprovincialis]